MPASFLQRTGLPAYGGAGQSLATVRSPPASLAAPPAADDRATDDELERVGRAARGDAEAQAWLLQQVMPRVRRITRALLRSPADADDAAQLALLAILRSASTYRGEASLAAWARRIAARTTLRFLARERRAPSAAAADNHDGDELAAPVPSRPSEALARDVHEYLGELPEAQRTAILLHHALGHSVDEIAALTEVSPDTVKGRLKLGMAALRKRTRQEIAIGRRRQS